MIGCNGNAGATALARKRRHHLIGYEMRLSTRLLLLVLGCLIPMVVAQTYTQVSLYQQHKAELGDLALRQAELANADLGSIIDGVRQIGAVVAAFPEVDGLTAGCSDRLASLRRNLPAYSFLAIANPAGRLVCASSPALLAVPTGPWLANLLSGSQQDIGDYATAQGIDGPFLPLCVPLPRGTGAMVVGLDLHGLSRHLQDTQLERAPLLHNSTLVVGDRHGTVIARFPDAEQWLGRSLPDSLQPLVGQAAPASTIVTGGDGRELLAAFIPATVPPVGLFAVEILPLANVMATTEGAIWRNTALMTGAALLALLLAWVLARRFIYRPAERLIAAAERWGNGDLHARAEVDRNGGEFTTLAQAFNAMASSLATRAHEQQLAAELLEAQVAERSRELSDNNNRLQVEIAEREKTEAALSHAQKLQAVGQLAGGISHDFNNMLTTVLGSLELMERRVANGAQRWTETDAERLQVLITRAIGAVQRGADLSSGLLRFARRPRAAARPTDVNRLITDLVTLATSAVGRRVRLVTELEPAPWPVQVDPSQMEAAVLNLCLNARDAMPEGGTVTIRTANTVLTDAQQVPGTADSLPPGSYFSITVTDTGTGMAPDVQRRAFEPFFSTKGDAGSGLGLSQVHGMVRQAGGIVRLHSNPGEGTEVTLLLPRAASDAAATQVPRAQGGLRHKLPPMTVLVVDDDNAVRQVTVEMLRDLGSEVQQAQGGAEALMLLSAAPAPPDVILLDYAMPGMNGLALARRLRENGLTVPIGMVTGYADLADVDAGESPLDGLLRKPFSIEELLAMMLRLSGHNRPRSNVIRLHVPQRG